MAIKCNCGGFLQLLIREIVGTIVVHMFLKRKSSFVNLYSGFILLKDWLQLFECNPLHMTTDWEIC